MAWRGFPDVAATSIFLLIRRTGRGGRNVEFLLSLAVALNGLPNVWALAGDTDGIDGAGPAAMSKDTKLGAGDFRAILPRFTPEAMEKNQALVDLLQRIAVAKGATPAQIAIAWVLAQKPFIVRITPETMAPYLAAGAAGFGLGSALYKPGMTATEVAETAAAFATAWRRDTTQTVTGERS